jgi:hypothetical protein
MTKMVIATQSLSWVRSFGFLSIVGAGITTPIAGEVIAAGFF